MESFETGSALLSTALQRHRVVQPQIENRVTGMWHGDSANQTKPLRSETVSAPSALRAVVQRGLLLETL